MYNNRYTTPANCLSENTISKKYLISPVKKCILGYMKTLQIIQLAISILLIASILLQQRGSGLGSAFGGDSAIYMSRRGAEKILFYFTITLAIAFVIIAVWLLSPNA